MSEIKSKYASILTLLSQMQEMPTFRLYKVDLALTERLILTLERQIGSQQAKIDQLMFEFCPEDMTPGQVEEWERNQKLYVQKECDGVVDEPSGAVVPLLRTDTAAGPIERREVLRFNAQCPRCAVHLNFEYSAPYPVKEPVAWCVWCAEKNRPAGLFFTKGAAEEAAVLPGDKVRPLYL